MRCGSFLWRFAAICAVLGCTMKCVRAFVPTRRREALGFRAASTLRPAATSGPLRSSTSRPTAYQRGRMQQPFRLLAQTIDKPDVTVRCAPPDFATEANEKYFEFSRLEKSIYEWWEQAGYFQPSSDTAKKPYVIPMPPPNVTGYLHMGHAMFVALQDIMARFHRMRGKATLWLPGTDHAGIATQLLVERAVVAEGTTRQAMGREAFLDRVWAWKEEKGGYITGQMRRLGASADWTRERFTLEPSMSDSVTEAFVRMHERGLIYKGDYLVNWSPNLQTAVSDLEVEYSEEMGKLYYFKYQLADEDAFIPVATTRPETILGDTAVCVHPEDERYKAFVGRKVKVPMSDREIPVIADDYVDREFGTGALKITPAHDPNDYELGKKHGLPMISVMNKDASINEKGGAYAGLDRFACRDKLWADMDAAGLVIKADPHMQRVPRSQRGGEVIEPMVSGQWFVKMDNMASRAVQAVRSKEITIIPERFEKTWYGWLENIHDWCVSRQLWWGHRIPAYYPEGARESTTEYVIARNLDEARTKAKEKWGKDVALVQDDDVLDTWFSSGLWPFATVGWPASEHDAKSDLSRFYPAAVLETGYDILFFWVARMVMMGLELTDKSPFHTIYMHGLVRDGQGQKMSKTKGNVIDPLEVVDQFGADALRYSLVTGSTPGQDVPLSMERIEANRNFANKLWNAGKYLQNVLAAVPAEERAQLAVTGPMSAAEMAALPVAERYIVSRCHGLVTEVTASLEAYSFGDAGRQIYEFLWDEYADWYIEVSKTRMRGSEDPTKAAASRRVLVYVWDTCLRLLHPFMPFLTEALWQQVPHRGASVMVADWPLQEGAGPLAMDQNADAGFRSMQALVRAIRNARAEYNVEMGKKIAATVRLSASSLPSAPELQELLRTEGAAVTMLARVEESAFRVEDGGFDPTSLGQAVHLVVEDGLEAFLPMAELVDYAKERARQGKQAEKLRKDIAGLEGRLASKGFADKAPPEVVAEVWAKVAEQSEQLAAVEKSIAEMPK